MRRNMCITLSKGNHDITCLLLLLQVRSPGKNAVDFLRISSYWGLKQGDCTLADLRGEQILLILCSFRENFAKSCILTHPGEFAPPPRENPGSVTAVCSVI